MGELVDDSVVIGGLGAVDLDAVGRLDGELVAEPVRTTDHDQAECQADVETALPEEGPSENDEQATKGGQQDCSLSVVLHESSFVTLCSTMAREG